MRGLGADSSQLQSYLQFVLVRGHPHEAIHLG